MSQVAAAAESDRRRFFTAEFWAIELILLFIMGISVLTLVNTEVWLLRNGERADVRVVTDLDGSYEVVYGDSVVVVGAGGEKIDVGDTISVVVDPDDPNVMAASCDVGTAVGFVAVAILAPVVFPVGRLLYVRHLRRASRPVAATSSSGGPESLARDPQPDPSR